MAAQPACPDIFVQLASNAVCHLNFKRWCAVTDCRGLIANMRGKAKNCIFERDRSYKLLFDL